MRISARGVLGLAAAALVSACSSTEPASSARLVVRLADGPGQQVESATVLISSVYLVPGTDPSGAHIPVATFDPPREYELTALQNGVSALLGETTVDPGDYSQLRLVVDHAEVTLKAPLTFPDGSSSITLMTPSAQQTGIKVNFDAPVHVEPGVTVLVVDFDVGRNFVFTGPPSAPTGMLFTPVLHATAMDIASTISGTVGPVPWTADDHVTVFAQIPLNGDPNATDSTIVATATPDLTTGAYTLRYLDPRVNLTTPFTVYVTAVGFTHSTPPYTTVDMPNTSGANTVTDVNFTLAP
jgi:hypothetical protein